MRRNKQAWNLRDKRQGKGETDRYQDGARIQIPSLFLHLTMDLRDTSVSSGNCDEHEKINLKPKERHTTAEILLDNVLPKPHHLYSHL